MSLLVDIPAPAPARSVPAPALVMRCGGIDCPPGTCDHTDDPADAAVHRSTNGAAVGGGPVPPGVLRVLDTPGTPLDSSVRTTMQARLGHDFGRVRVHTDAEAARSARSIQAHAYTFGSHVVMAAGRFQPHTPSGNQLLTHELTHVVQQAGVSEKPTRISDPGDAAEQEAERAARSVARQRFGRQLHAETHGVKESALGHGDGRGRVNMGKADARSAERESGALADLGATAPAPTRVYAGQRPAAGSISRQLDPSMCATDCTTADATRPATGKYHLTVFADKEGPLLLIPLTKDVGHSWVELGDKDGNYWTYGFWPQSGFDAAHPTKDVPGCVWKGSQRHKPSAQQTFELTKAEFDRAHAMAVSLCASRPTYNLFGLQCTEFARRILVAAGKGTALGFGLIFESPAALNSWLTSNQLVIGASVTGATTAAGGQGTGTFGLHAEYTHQFLAALGNKLRLQWITRGELSSRMASLSTGAGVEITTQRVYLPRAYLFGGVTAGELTPGSLGSGTDRFGAGVTAGAGLRYNVDEFATVGVEANVVKDVINEDPALGRLMVTAGFNF